MTTNRNVSSFLDVWKDALLEVYMETPAPATGASIPATGFTDIELSIGATEQGAGISGLVALAAERTGAPGWYFRVVDLSSLTTQLDEPTYPHMSTVYVQVRKSGDILVESFRKVIRRKKF